MHLELVPVGQHGTVSTEECRLLWEGRGTIAAVAVHVLLTHGCPDLVPEPLGKRVVVNLQLRELNVLVGRDGYEGGVR